jgi:putative ATP-binding cassette transporter
MMEHADTTCQTVAERGTADGLALQLKMILEALYGSRDRATLLWLGTGLVAVVAATAYGQIRLNAWNQPFYDALSRKDLSVFGSQLFVFMYIAGALLILDVAQTWLNQMMKMKLREGLTRDLFAQWLAPKRAFLLAGAKEIGENPDQRLHEDSRHLAELSTDLGAGLLQATLLLASFIGVLWVLSAGVTFELQGKSFVIPGYMVWSALLYAGAASWASWRVGRPLIHLNAERYARESDLRFAVIAAPAYFAGDLSFGGLLMAVGAFNQVQQSLRWFVDNFGVIADWRATLFRVGGFRQALIEMDKLGDEASRIELVTTAVDKLCLDDFGVISPSGCAMLNEPQVEILPGDRVLIVGAPGSGKTTLFRAIAGLWPWGSGRICLPPARSVMFVPKRPYIPDGPLRSALAYPNPPRSFTDEEFIAALTKMGLSHLSRWLDRITRWDRELSEPEQQGLAFARVLLHKPRWVFVDEAIESLAPQARKTLFDIFEQDWAATTLVHISGPQAKDKFYTRVLYLTMNPRGQRLKAPLPCDPEARRRRAVLADSR